MKIVFLCLSLITFANNAFSQACWSEWERDGAWLMRAGKCTENVSIANVEKLCRSRVKSDEPRTAAACPSSAKVFSKGKVYNEPMEFRCLNLQPPGAGGAANIVHYGLSKTPEDMEMVRNLCTQFGGTWEAAK